MEAVKEAESKVMRRRLILPIHDDRQSRQIFIGHMIFSSMFHDTNARRKRGKFQPQVPSLAEYLV